MFTSTPRDVWNEINNEVNWDAPTVLEKLKPYHPKRYRAYWEQHRRATDHFREMKRHYDKMTFDYNNAYELTDRETLVLECLYKRRLKNGEGATWLHQIEEFFRRRGWVPNHSSDYPLSKVLERLRRDRRYITPVREIPQYEIPVNLDIGYRLTKPGEIAFEQNVTQQSLNHLHTKKGYY